MLDEKSDKAYDYILIYDISYKTLMGAKPLRIRFDEIDGFIKIYDGIRYVLLFRSEQYDAIYIRIRYLIRQKMVSDYSYDFATIRIDSYNLYLQKKH